MTGGRELTGQLMELGNGGHMPANGGQLHSAVGHLRHVSGDRSYLSGKVGDVVVLTVIMKAAQVRRVTALGIQRSLQARLDMTTDGKGKLDQRVVAH